MDPQNRTVNENVNENVNEIANGNEPKNGNESEAAAPKRRKPSLAEDVFDIFECFVFSLCIVFLLFSCITRICIVDGQSMDDTLADGQKLIVSRLAGAPERGDIVVFHETGSYFNEPLVKRVIATEGEYVDIRAEGDRLVVTVYDSDMQNPVVLTEDYACYKDRLNVNTVHDYPVRVPEGCLFVMGDNRNHSTDSRSALVGFVDCRRVLGTLLLRLTPFSEFGPVD
jgi:signal peptidase I